MLIIGLTGGVASGKNFVADQFKKLKIPVFDADLQVHKLLIDDKKVFEQIKINFPQVIINGKIDRSLLSEEVFKNKEKLDILEKIIYPALREKENKFVKNCRHKRHKIVVLNIPLLFEKGSYKRCHKNIVVVSSDAVRFLRFKKRFQAKYNGDENSIRQKFLQITNHQINDLERKKRADIVINNNLGKAFTTLQAKNITRSLLAKQLQSK